MTTLRPPIGLFAPTVPTGREPMPAAAESEAAAPVATSTGK